MGAFLLSREECAAIHRKEGCPALVREDHDEEEGITFYEAPTPPDYDRCPGVLNLKSYCGSRAEALFFRHWCLAHYFGTYHDYRHYYEETLSEWREHSSPDATYLVIVGAPGGVRASLAAHLSGADPTGVAQCQAPE
jgi:hypothetical protein